MSDITLRATHERYFDRVTEGVSGRVTNDWLTEHVEKLAKRLIKHQAGEEKGKGHSLDVNSSF